MHGDILQALDTMRRATLAVVLLGLLASVSAGVCAGNLHTAAVNVDKN